MTVLARARLLFLLLAVAVMTACAMEDPSGTQDGDFGGFQNSACQGCPNGCTADGVCLPDEGMKCMPDCYNRRCGRDGCGGECPNFCTSDQLCTEFGACGCKPNCPANKVCGADGCGSLCGMCGVGNKCMEDGSRCIPCEPGEDSKECRTGRPETPTKDCGMANQPCCSTAGGDATCNPGLTCKPPSGEAGSGGFRCIAEPLPGCQLKLGDRCVQSMDRAAMNAMACCGGNLICSKRGTNETFCCGVEGVQCESDGDCCDPTMACIKDRVPYRCGPRVGDGGASNNPWDLFDAGRLGPLDPGFNNADPGSSGPTLNGCAECVPDKSNCPRMSPCTRNADNKYYCTPPNVHCDSLNGAYDQITDAVVDIPSQIPADVREDFANRLCIPWNQQCKKMLGDKCVAGSNDCCECFLWCIGGKCVQATKDRMSDPANRDR